MKVFYRGFNLYDLFPKCEEFIDFEFERVEKIEVSHTFSVFLVANTIELKGGKKGAFQIDGDISQVLCAEDKVLILLKNGELLKILNSLEKVPKLPDLEEDDQIEKISCGSKMTIALTKKGGLYNYPNRLNFNSKHIIDAKTGREHCLLLDKNGNVLSFGGGSRGQLGHGSLDDEAEPKFIEALGGVQIVAIATGGWHSCALSKTGDLYIWGWNSNGQLGLQSEEKDENVGVMATPRVLDFEFNISQVACGSRHTIILLDNGELYGCGWNKYKQLKNDAKENVYSFICLRSFGNNHVDNIQCGPWSSLVVCK